MSEPFVNFSFPEPLPVAWKCQLFGVTGPYGGMILQLPEGSQPNWFWRWMQYLAFGNKWTHLP